MDDGHLELTACTSEAVEVPLGLVKGLPSGADVIPWWLFHQS
jgi:hypothetical protein